MSEKTVAHELEELRQLAGRIFSAVGDVGPPVADDLSWSSEGIYWDVASIHARHWPEDKAAQLIAEWRAA
jgi:hypothetical protein